MDQEVQAPADRAASPPTGRTKRRWLPRLRFSLGTLIIGVLLIGSAGGLGYTWSPWYVEQVIKDHTREVRSLCFSPDGRFVLSSGWDAVVRVRDLRSGTSTALHGHTDCANSILAPNGCRIASSGQDKQLLIWGLDGQRKWGVTGQKWGFGALAFSHDSSLLAAGSGDGTTRVLDAETGTPIAQLLEHTNTVSSAVFSNDDRWVLTASYDGTIRLADTQTGRPRLLLQHGAPYVWFAMFSPDATTILSSSQNGLTRLWNAQTGDAGAALMPVPSGPPPIVAVKEPDVICAAFSTDGSRILAGRRDGTVYLWRATDGQVLQLLAGHSDCVVEVGFLPDQRRVFSASYDGSARIWDSVRGRCLAVLSSYPAGELVAALAPDGTRLAITAPDGPYTVWRCRRPEYWWGIAWLPEFWLTILFSAAFVWSVWRDRRDLRHSPETVYCLKA